jgi:hypothetical protein
MLCGQFGRARSPDHLCMCLRCPALASLLWRMAEHVVAVRAEDLHGLLFDTMARLRPDGVLSGDSRQYCP